MPSIPLVESLPSRLENKSSYVYAGPLLISDQEMMGPLTYSGDIFGMIDAFFTKNADTKIVYCTVGLSEPSQLITRAQRCIRYLLDHNLAVITNVIDLPLDDAGQQSRLFASGYLPMDQVCSKVDLIIHQCGNGVYNYQLKHKIPGITLGSACYDRDDVAMKIEKLGAVGFIPAGLDDEAYNEKFSEMVRQLLDPSSEEYMTQKAALLKLHEEMIHVQQNFDFEKIVNQLISTAPEHNQA